MSGKRTCSVEGCQKKHRSNGFCAMHNARARKHGDVGPANRVKAEREAICTVEGCAGKHVAKGYCVMHYLRAKRHGDPGPAEPAITRGIEVCTVDGCCRKHVGKGYCQLHFNRVQRYGNPGPARPLIGQIHVCSVEGCARKHRAKGYCQLHYLRVKKNGNPGSAHRLVADSGSGGIDRYGYRQITVAGKKVAEHRYVMEQALGRSLRRDENVHHLNGQRTDNRLENLELWSTSQPSGQRIEDKLAWAEEILARYLPPTEEVLTHALSPAALAAHHNGISIADFLESVLKVRVDDSTGAPLDRSPREKRDQ